MISLHYHFLCCTQYSNMDKYLTLLAMLVCRCYADDPICDFEYDCTLGTTTGATLMDLSEDECLQVL